MKGDDSKRYRLMESPKGGLLIWEWPEPGKKYVVGVDSSSGVAGGDFSSAEVVEMESCAQVAEWHGLYDPTDWGRRCARLGWLYGDAVLAFETYPTAHGLSAARAAEAYGYLNLYRRQQLDQVTRKFTTHLGWHTHVQTKGLMVNRVRLALQEGHRIRSETLLRELRSMRLGEAEAGQREKIVAPDHDDCHDAYAIALCVRDSLYQESRSGGPTKADDGLERWERAHWRRWLEDESLETRRERLDDGV